MYARPINAPKVAIQSYTHTQSSASATWSIAHNLGRAVSVTATNGSGEEIEGTITHVNLNSVTITFSQAIAGQAFVT